MKRAGQGWGQRGSAHRPDADLDQGFSAQHSLGLRRVL